MFPGQSRAQTSIFSFAQTLYVGNVNQTNATISVVLGGSPFVTLAVDFVTMDGTATAGVDYVSTTGTLVFTVGQVTNTFNVQMLDNGIAQSTQTVNLVLLNPTPPAVLGFPSNAVLAIVNTASQAVQFAQSSFTVNQGESNVVINLTRTGGSNTTATVFFSTSDGSAKAGVDYVATSGTVTFSNGLNTASVTIPILPGVPLITNQTVNLTLSNPNGMVLGSPSTAKLTIIATGPTVLQFSQPTYNILAHVGKATLNVIRFGSSVSNASVDFATSDGTAVSGVDYTGVNGTLVFPTGTELQSILVPFLKFKTFQSNKTFSATISNAAGGSLGTQTTALVTIVNDKPQTVLVTNVDGAVATLQLKGGGTMDVPPGPVPSNIVFSATTPGTTLSIKVKKATNGNAFVQMGGFTGDGDLKSISAKNVDLTGSGIQIAGFVPQIQIHDLLNGGSISLGGNATNSTKITAHNIDDSAAITTTCRIASLTAARIGDVTITAPSIGSISLKGDKKAGIPGDFNGLMQLTGAGVAAGGSALGKVSVSGAISNAVINIVTGSLDSIAAAEILDSTIYDGFVPTDPNNLLLGGVFVPDLLLKSLSVKASTNAFANTVIAASKMGSIKLSSMQTDNGGELFGVLGDQSISSVTSKTPPFKWSSTGGTDQFLGDFHVILP